MTPANETALASTTAGPSQIELERRTYRARQGRRSTLVSIASTLIVGVLVRVGVVNTPGWVAVQQSFFDPQTAIDSLPEILLGLWLNVRILFFAAIGVAIFGTMLAIVRGLQNPVFFPLRLLATGYTDLFRGLPLIIVPNLVGYGLPGLGAFPESSPKCGARSQSSSPTCHTSPKCSAPA